MLGCHIKIPRYQTQMISVALHLKSSLKLCCLSSCSVAYLGDLTTHAETQFSLTEVSIDLFNSGNTARYSCRY